MNNILLYRKENKNGFDGKRKWSSCIKDFIQEVGIYFRIEMKHIASFGISTALFSMVIPLGIIIMFSMMPIKITKEAAILYISGNFITSISNICLVTLAKVLSGVRAKNGFEHFATLPIFVFSPMIGIFLSFFATTIPSLVIMPLIGSLLFNITFSINFGLIFVLVITMIMLIGFGAILGTFSDDYQKTNTLSMIAMFFVMFGTPVYYSFDRLPFILKVFQRLLPFSYSLEAVRQLMTNFTLNATVVRDILVLLGWMIVSLIGACKFVNWKQRD